MVSLLNLGSICTRQSREEYVVNNSSGAYIQLLAKSLMTQDAGKVYHIIQLYTDSIDNSENNTISIRDFLTRKYIKLCASILLPIFNSHLGGANGSSLNPASILLAPLHHPIIPIVGRSSMIILLSSSEIRRADKMALKGNEVRIARCKL
jgi:hypothetical protein